MGVLMMHVARVPDVFAADFLRDASIGGVAYTRMSEGVKTEVEKRFPSTFTRHVLEVDFGFRE